MRMTARRRRAPGWTTLGLGGPIPIARPRRAPGWTLIELTIVISLMTVLSTIALVGYRNAVIRSREAVLKENLFRMRDAIDQHYTDLGLYPAGLDALVGAGYLRAVPVDPFTGSAATWRAVPAAVDRDDLLAAGIYDVRSGSGETALDGTAYAAW